MSRLRIRRLPSVLVVATFVLGALSLVATPISAAPTDKNLDDQFLVITVHETVDVFDACAFPLVARVDGFFKIRFPASQPNGVLRVESYHLSLRWENPANGKTSNVIVAETDRIVDNGDGTGTAYASGLPGIATVPGVGRVSGDTGHLVYTFDIVTGEPLSLVLLAGPHTFGVFPALCDYLA